MLVIVGVGVGWGGVEGGEVGSGINVVVTVC